MGTKSLRVFKDGIEYALDEEGILNIEGRSFKVERDFENGEIRFTPVCKGDFASLSAQMKFDNIALYHTLKSQNNASIVERPFVSGNYHYYYADSRDKRYCFDCLRDEEKAGIKYVTFNNDEGRGNTALELYEQAYMLSRYAEKCSSVRMTINCEEGSMIVDLQPEYANISINPSNEAKEGNIVAVASDLVIFLANKYEKPINELIIYPKNYDEDAALLAKLSSELIASAKYIKLPINDKDEAIDILAMLKRNMNLENIVFYPDYGCDSGYDLTLTHDRAQNKKHLSIFSKNGDRDDFFAICSAIDAIYDESTITPDTVDIDGQSVAAYRYRFNINNRGEKILSYANDGYCKGYVAENAVGCDTLKYCNDEYTTSGYVLDDYLSASDIFGIGVIETVMQSGYCDGYCKSDEVAKSLASEQIERFGQREYIFLSNTVNDFLNGISFDSVSTCFSLEDARRLSSFKDIGQVIKVSCPDIDDGDDLTLAQRVAAHKQTVVARDEFEAASAMAKGAERVVGEGIEYIKGESIECSQAFYDKVANKISVKEVHFSDLYPNYPCYFGRGVESVSSKGGRFNIVSYFGGFKHGVSLFNGKEESPYVEHLSARDQAAEYDKLVETFCYKEGSNAHGYIDKGLIEKMHAKIDAEALYRFVAGADVKYAISKIATPFYPPSRVLSDAYKNKSDRLFVSFKPLGVSVVEGEAEFNEVNEYEDLSSSQSCEGYEFVNPVAISDYEYEESIQKTRVLMDSKSKHIYGYFGSYFKHVEKTNTIDTIEESGSLSEVFSAIDASLQTLYSNTSGDYEISLDGIESIEAQVQRIASEMRSRFVTAVITNHEVRELRTSGFTADVVGGGILSPVHCFNTTSSGFTSKRVYMEQVGDALLPQAPQKKKSDIVKYVFKREADGSLFISWDTSDVDKSKVPFFMHFNGTKIPIKEVV